jgi:predicted nucleic acid-binding protein
VIHSPKFIAVLDACVIYPAPMRDLLLNLADVHLYTPKWTDQIHEEWTRNLLKNRNDLQSDHLQRVVTQMNRAFPDANVIKYERLMGSVRLPDPDDCHVLAAAIRCDADVIVTTNLKDFPAHFLHEFDIEAQHPDQFISILIDLDSEKAIHAFRNQVERLKNPPLTPDKVLDNLNKAGLVATCTQLRALL